MAIEEIQEFEAWKVRLTSDRAPVFDVVWLPSGFENKSWMRQVTEDSKASRTLFLQPGDNQFLLYSFEFPSGNTVLTDDEVIAASHVLLEERRLTAGSEACLQIGDQRRNLLLEPGRATTVLKDTIRTDDSLHNLIRSENQESLDNLVEQLRSPLGVIPFVGAGMSKAFGFPEWGEFLSSAAEGTKQGADLKRRTQEGDYEGVADELWRIDPDRLQRRIDHTYRRELNRQMLITHPLSLVAALVNGPVITTNFDQVLEETFRACGKAFKDCIYGPQPDRIVKAIHRNRLSLLKIHGDCEDRTFRTFTKWEYERSYEPSKAEHVTLSSIAWLMFTNRPLLFLGCSLERDRTVNVLQEIHQTLRGLTHFAVLASHYSASQLSERRDALSACGISPIWFFPKKFSEIEDILRDLLDRSSTRELFRPTHLQMPVMPSEEKATTEFKALTTEFGRPLRTDLLPSIERIARVIVGGKSAFFLGTYAHLGTVPLGDEFYQYLAEKFDVPPVRDRSEVARYILDCFGSQALWDEYKSNLSISKIKPSLVYRFLATLPGFLRAAGRDQAASILLLTTNYDITLEHTFEEVGEPFHLLYYLSSGEDEGLFAHRTPDGRERVLERPENIQQFREPGTIILKLDGGHVYGKKIPESVLIARGDFDRLAGRLPNILPAAIRMGLRDRSLLFLGHGLHEPHIEALIRYAYSEGLKREAWAVQKGAPYERVRYWAGCGLQIVDSDLQDFMLNLHASIVELSHRNN
jgi:hypothetical protein